MGPARICCKWGHSKSLNHGPSTYCCVFLCSPDVSLQGLGSGCISVPQRGASGGVWVMGPARFTAILVLS